MNQQSWIIKPDLKKVIIIQTLIILGICLAFIGIYYILMTKEITLIQDILQSFEVLGINISIDVSKVGMVAGVVILVSYLLSFLKYNQQHTFFPHMYVTHSKVNIPFENITRIMYKKDSLTQNIFSYGTIIIEASMTDTPSYEIPFTSNVEQTTQQLQGLVDRYKSYKAQQEQQQTRVENILNQW